MSRTHWYNGLAAVVTLAASLGLGALARPKHDPLRAVRREATRGIPVVTLPSGGQALRDATGTLVPLVHYQRIASATTLSDAALWELCEQDRVVAYAARSGHRRLIGHHYAGKQLIESLSNAESMLSLKPDLLLVNHYTDAGFIAHLRNSGIAVFDLGEMRGLSTLGTSIRTIARLVDHVEQGEHLVAHLQRGMAGLASSIPEAERQRALYLSTYGNEIYGAGDDTSYHDVITAAGLRDASIGRFHDFPVLGPEQILALDPELIVTKTNMGAQLCDQLALKTLRACTQPGGIVELDAELLDDPGLGMLEAAETLYALAHPLAHPGRP